MSEISLTPSDLEKLVRDQVRKEVADAAVANMERANEHGERALKDGGGLAQLVAEARGRETTPRAEVVNGRVVNDPLKGRGLAFTRFVRTVHLAHTTQRTPLDVAQEFAKVNKAYEETADLPHVRAMSQSAFTAGGALVPPEMAAEIVELLYARTVVQSMGARELEFTASISLGKLNSGASVSYVGEAGNIVPTQPGTAELRMTGKKASAIVPISNELLRNPRVGADAIIRDDLLTALALRRDLSALRGTGDQYQPKGIKNAVNASNIFNSAGTTTANKVADLTKAIRLVDESNVPLDSGGWVVSPRSKWALFATLDTNSNFVFAAQLALGMLLGFPLRTTTQIPNNLGGGTDTEVHFGAWNDLILGFDTVTPLQVKLSEDATFYDGSAVVSGFSSDQSAVRLLEGHDMCLRHDNTFSRIDAVAWT